MSSSQKMDLLFFYSQVTSKMRFEDDFTSPFSPTKQIMLLKLLLRILSSFKLFLPNVDLIIYNKFSFAVLYTELNIEFSNS